MEIALAGALLITAFLFVEESGYKRPPPTSDASDMSSEKSKSHTEHVEISHVPIPARRSFWQTVTFWSPVDHEVEFFWTAIRSFSYFLVPSVLWVVSTYGIYIGLGALTFNYTFPMLITVPPYNWSQENSGLVCLGNVIGYALAIPLLFTFDRLAAYLTKRNGDIREAEMRLGVMLPAALIAPAGLIVYGMTAERHLHWIGYFFGVAMCNWGACKYSQWRFAEMLCVAHGDADDDGHDRFLLHGNVSVCRRLVQCQRLGDAHRHVCWQAAHQLRIRSISARLGSKFRVRCHHCRRLLWSATGQQSVRPALHVLREEDATLFRRHCSGKAAQEEHSTGHGSLMKGMDHKVLFFSGTACQRAILPGLSTNACQILVHERRRLNHGYLELFGVGP